MINCQLGYVSLNFLYIRETPIGFEYNNEHYYYVTNLQGDIIAILDNTGNCVAEYSYDAWGNCTIVSDTDGIAEINPLRYRGYYFDSDIGLYYLQSRYYDANVGRFINSDEPEMLLNNVSNLFTYCKNNPVMLIDPTGRYNAHVFSINQFYDESRAIRDELKRWNYSCEVYKINNAKQFIKQWNKIKSAKVVVLNSHGSPTTIFGDLGRKNIREKLKRIDCKVLIILGCNAGRYSYMWNNVAYELSLKITGVVVASDGYVTSLNQYVYSPNFNSVSDNPKWNNLGWVLYKSVYGKKHVTTTWYSTNMYSITMIKILRYLAQCGLR